jgi:hypothetical protein
VIDTETLEARALIRSQPALPDLEATKVLLAAALAEKGEDYIYPDAEKRNGVCQYVHGGKPSCLVGNVLHRAGWSIEALQAADAESLWEWLPDQDDQTGDGRRLLSDAQWSQDRGEPWGMAVETALAKAAGLEAYAV